MNIRKIHGDIAKLVIPKKQNPQQIMRNLGITLAILGAASLVCALLVRFNASDSAVPLVFVLAVLFTALLTDGGFYSLVASVAAVFGVNFAFTYPYFELDFTLTGYPITFLTMFTVSIVVGMLTEQVKRQSIVQAEAESEKIKANLLRSVSHDLRTPLTSIIGSTGAVMDNYDIFSDEVKKDLIGNVRDDAQWLMRLVENILSITRINTGEVKIHKSEEAVEEIAAEAVAKFRKRFDGVQIRVRVPEDFLMIPMDALLIEQVIINLMENAVLHGKGTKLIELSISRQGSNAVFSVQDDGCGIDAHVLPKLFQELFPHAQEQRGDGRRSLGIGLSVCRSIVEAHGGTMKAENIPGGGARISFALPLEEE